MPARKLCPLHHFPSTSEHSTWPRPCRSKLEHALALARGEIKAAGNKLAAIAKQAADLEKARWG